MKQRTVALGIILVTSLCNSHLVAATHTRKERSYMARYKLPPGPISYKLDETFKLIKDPKDAFELAGWKII